MAAKQKATPEGATDTESTEFLAALIIVFCRVCGLEDMPLDKLADAQRVLHDVCGKANKDFPDDVYAVHSSVYGRFLACRTPAPALAMAKQILHEAAAKGVPVSIGVAREGRVEPFSDFGMRPNLIGIPINTAARLAFVEKDWNFICVESSVATAAEAQRESLAGPLGVTLEGKVKRTALRYRRLQTPAPGLGELPRSNSATPDIPVAVVVYDIVGYSGKKLDDAMDFVNRLRNEVGKALDQIGGKQWIRDEKLWYSPAGDGGVVVFRQENRDSAWEFAVALAEQCRKANIEIRLAAALGEAVLIAGDLPVGSTVVRTDKICGHPNTWQICVEKSFWPTLKDDVRAGWVAEQVDGDSEAVLLMPRRAETFGSRLKETRDAALQEQPHERNLNTARKILGEDSKFADELLDALRADFPKRSANVGDVVEVFRIVGLNEFLLAIHRMLENKSRYDHGDRLAKLLDELMPVGLDSSWIKHVRARLAGAGGAVSVPVFTEAFEAEIAKAAVMGGSTRFDKASDGLPRGEDYVEFGEVEPRGPSRQDVEREFKQSILAKCGITHRGSKGLRILESQLRAYWRMGRPIYTLTGDILAGAAGDFPWHYLLVLNPDDIETEFEATRETAVYVQSIYRELRRLGKIA